MGRSFRGLMECGVNEGSDNENVLVQRFEVFRMVVLTSWKLVAYTLATAMALAVVGSLLTTPQYRASAIIHISPVWGQEFKVEQVMNEELNRIRNARQFYRTQMEIMVSRPVLTGVAEKFNAMFDTANLNYSDVEGSTSVTPVPSSELLDVSVVWPNPEEAAALANFVSETYSQHNLEARRGASRDAQRYLTSRLQDYEGLILEANERLLAYQMANNLADAEEDITELSSRMNSLSEAKAETTTQRVMLEAAVAYRLSGLAGLSPL